jgi:hypothetical protein
MMLTKQSKRSGGSLPKAKGSTIAGILISSSSWEWWMRSTNRN